MSEQTYHTPEGERDTYHADAEHHVVPLRIYYSVFAALMILLVATIGVALVDLGVAANLIFALGIAAGKALLIVFFFMHVKFSSRLTKLFAGAGLFWLAIMFVLTFSDYSTRPEQSWGPSPLTRPDRSPGGGIPSDNAAGLEMPHAR